MELKFIANVGFATISTANSNLDGIRNMVNLYIIKLN